MSDAVHRIAPTRLARGLAAATALLGLAGGASALAFAGLTGATAVASAPVKANSQTSKPSDPLACAAVFNYGICVSPPVTF